MCKSGKSDPKKNFNTSVFSFLLNLLCLLLLILLYIHEFKLAAFMPID